MAEVSERELERFFAEVAPRLETAQTLDDELDRQLARRFNVFRYLRTDEMGFSRMIADLLDPAGDHGQGAAFLKLLTEKLEFATDVNPSDLGNAKVQTERQIDDRRIDILVEIDGKHCLAIENKSNFAGDQDGQVEYYLHWLKRKYGHSLLIYLSPTGEGPSEESVAREVIEDLATEDAQRFVIMPCGSSELADDATGSPRLAFSLVDWLADCRRSCDVDRLRWYLREIETYCRRQFGGMTVTDSKKSAVADFLRKDSNNLATALAVYETWPEVARETRNLFFELIKDRIWDDLRESDEYIQWNHGEKRYESYIAIYRESWRPYIVDGQDKRTCVQMQADSKEDADWYVGVWSPPVRQVSEDDRERREKLQRELGNLGIRQSLSLPCWEYVEKYRDWNPLIPQLREEVMVAKHQGASAAEARGGEIAEFFVGKFNDFVGSVIRIIDSVDGAD